MRNAKAEHSKHLLAVARGSFVVAMNAIDAGLLDFAAASAREGALAARDAAAMLATIGDVGIGLKQLNEDTNRHTMRPNSMLTAALARQVGTIATAGPEQPYISP